MAKALIVVRLSRLTDATTSPERQLEKCRELCLQRGYEVVGVAEDLDVSAGKTSPFDRPQLGDWLKNRPGEFDVLVFFRADRVVRRLFDLADLIRWGQKHSVILVSATESYFDLSTDFGDIIALLVAKVAEMELAAISERNASAAQYNIRAGKYRGGVPPWGYLPDDSTGEWRLVQDPAQVMVIREVVVRVLDSEPLRSVAHDLTARKVPTPRDCFAAHKGREVKGYEWHSSGLKRSLTSETLLGYAVSGDKPVRTDDGSPVLRADPILTREVFERVGVELADRENRKEPTQRSTGLLLQVIRCGVCGKPAYRLKGGEGRAPRYRCASAQYKTRCGNKSIPLDHADKLVEGVILRMLGESERLERLWDSGSDYSTELADIDAQLVDLVGLLGSSDFRQGTPQRVRLNERVSSLAARQAELSVKAVKPAGWTWEPTGETFGAWWGRQDTTARNVWLRSMGVRLEFEQGQLRLDLGDIETLTQQMSPSGAVSGWQQVFAAMQEGAGEGEGAIAGMEIREDGIEFVSVKGERLWEPLT
jgi:site-specific DNA recombinase